MPFFFLVLFIFLLVGCEQQPVLNPPPNKQTIIVNEKNEPILSPTPRPSPIVIVKPNATPIPTPNIILGNPEGPILTEKGHALIVEFEVGGRNGYKQHCEAPDWKYSGITEGIGYDNHTNSANIIFKDWMRLGVTSAKRLSETHPYYGPTAKAHLKDVVDILIPWSDAIGLFDTVDVARTYSQCKKAFKGFEDLRLNAQAALISLVFNRGTDMTGPNRLEMRLIRDAVPKKDYDTIASAEIKMIRVWIGTENYKGLKRRREAESQLILTP